MSVQRIYVEKKPEFDAEAARLLADLRISLKTENLRTVRVINRYDAELMSEADFENAALNVFSEPAVDVIYSEIPKTEEFYHIFAVEPLPGQFDQRADSCEQCIQIMTGGERPRIKNAKVYMIDGKLNVNELIEVKNYIINPVESREASLELPETLEMKYDIPDKVKTLTGFTGFDNAALSEFLKEYGLAMDLDDLMFLRDYFAKTEKRDPTVTEIRMIDTYWSDHCRHTTFLTEITETSIDAPYIREAYEQYIEAREQLGRGDKPITLMDLATIGARKLKADGILKNLDESEEINACSVKVKADINGKPEDWLMMFKNETHNHPTEIEPFGGAATCLGGAIRDPLSGRSYVYNAMRVTGAANPLVPIADTMKGKLPQRKITVGAANGYSSYGNQIGLATGLVDEIYHPGYAAKRLEIGAVVGAAPEANVRRERPAPGDIVILLGGRTGRDGCGGATGSSKSHSASSSAECGAEVQKGNPPEERKLQRLFRNPEVTKLIKRCNDFGAGGVSVAIGELADGLVVDLSKVLRKYDGLDGTELAISESQERMAVVVSPEDAETFIKEAEKENLEATIVADVTEAPRLKMVWNGNTVVDISREFLNSNGARKFAAAYSEMPVMMEHSDFTDTPDSYRTLISNLNICSKKGLSERFDSTIGAGTVLMPFGGAYQMTPAQASVAKFPAEHGETDTVSVMTYGFNPFLSEKNPFLGAECAVIESAAKVIAAGAALEETYLTFQEYFERLRDVPSRWGKPLSALLGAFKAQIELGLGSIGGKDSMSGSFENIDVPPTLVSFAAASAKASGIISPEFKAAGHKVILLIPEYKEDGTPDWNSIRNVFIRAENLIASGKVKAAYALGSGGVAEAAVKMAFGNRIGFRFTENLPDKTMFHSHYGAFIMEIEGDTDERVIGETISAQKLITPACEMDLDELSAAWENKLESVFPCNISVDGDVKNIGYSGSQIVFASENFAKPRVLIPVFPGTNCEYDTAKVFEKAGAAVETFIIKNLRKELLADSIKEFSNLIKVSQIIMLPGGFSGGDEPDGSAKFITAFFKNSEIAAQTNGLLKNRGGLMLGICNGFQALIKLGLIQFGEIVPQTSESPTLTFNTIGRHQSKIVDTRISSVKSPWFSGLSTGDIISVAISHGEGRFVAPSALIAQFAENGQIAAQYCDKNGNASMDIRFNPNSSLAAAEALCSPDGRVLGKMGHSERVGTNLYKNIPGNFDSGIFEAGVRFFK
ncbi:MAG: phosphoribosylformylglycinamidine synthase [Ruminococcus sp.]|jgi:phosphoribosylformylglycinamidine synthase|nr:phosphoribosylformylglycinamidine synthase [Ruminococcus sp.]